MNNKLVYIAHRVSGDIENNIKQIFKICNDIHKKDNNIIPFAPYLVALQYLDDRIIEERELGIQANEEHFRRKTMDEVWLCGPAISKGMEHEIKFALKYNIPIKCYSLKLQHDFDKLFKK
ncbi:DUF4406 domain-containing protein [Candidatus Parcubacteria bacterium]|nr:DUF4406 domain-containing protein [Candidatus Parcubacteria bacterium]